MNVKSIFTTLIIIVVCVVIGALTLNVLVPNVTSTVINATEDQIYRASGLSFDFNNDGTAGGATTTEYGGTSGLDGAKGAEDGGVGVDGVD